MVTAMMRGAGLSRLSSERWCGAKGDEWTAGATQFCAGRSNGFLAQVLGQAGKMLAEPRGCEVHEGAHPRCGQPAMRRNQVYRQWRRLMVGEHNLQRALAHMLGHLIGKQPRDTASAECGGDRAADAVDHEPRGELHCSRHARTD